MTKKIPKPKPKTDSLGLTPRESNSEESRGGGERVCALVCLVRVCAACVFGKDVQECGCLKGSPTWLLIPTVWL